MQTCELHVECVPEPADDLSNSPKTEFTFRGMHFYIDISGKFNHVQRDPEDRGHRVVEVTTKPHFRNVIDVNLPVANVVAMS
jgi:hypothetical protein